MSVDTKDKYRVLVKREHLTSTGLYPSSQEIYDLMHITTCDLAIARWNESWSFCPVCLARYEGDGFMPHRSRQEICV